MCVVFVCFALFMVIFLLVFFFHLSIWNFYWGVLNNLRSWVSSFECGFLPQQLTENYFSHTYFVLLVFFVIFDLEVSLLLNLPSQGALFKNLQYYFFFLVLLGFGFWIEIRKGYVSWSY